MAEVMRIFEANGAKACADCGRRGMVERDRLIAENDRLREFVLEMHQAMTDRCDGPHEQFHGRPCESCAEAGSSDCPKVIAEWMRDLGIEVK